MNVFDAIYLNENDPIEQSFIAAETALDIAIARANKEYVYESGLIELSDNKLFMEAGETTIDPTIAAKRENAFIKAIKAICNAIRNFIGDLVASIANIFDGRENIEPEEYLESPTGKIRLEKDIEKLEAIVDDEIRKGNKLLQKASSVTGISDEAIDNWVRSSAEALNKLAPVIIPAALGFGFKKIFSSSKMKEKTKIIDDAEKNATSGDNTDPKKNKQKTTILNHMNWLVKQIGTACTDWTKTMNKAKKKASKKDK